MPVASVPNASAAAAIDLAASNVAEHGNSHAFLALLNIAGGNNPGHSVEFRNDDPTQTASDNRGGKERNHPDTPVAAAVDVPNALKDAPDDPLPEPVREALDGTEPPVSDTQKNTSQANAADDAADGINNTESAAPEETSSETTLAVQTHQTTNDTTDTQSGQDLRVALGEQLGKIEQIIATVIQVLTGAIGDTPPAPSTDGVSTATTDVVPAVLSSSSPADISLLPSASLPAADAAEGETAGISDTLLLLKDIHAILRQMQKILLGEAQQVHKELFGNVPVLPEQANSAVIPGAADGSANLLTLTDLLQQKVTQLSKLLASQSSFEGDGKTRPVPGWLKLIPFSLVPSGSNGVPATASDEEFSTDIASLLKNGITEVRNQLKKLKGDNDTILTQLKNDIQTQFEQARTLFRDNNAASLVTVSTQTNVTVPVPDAPVASPVAANVSVSGAPNVQTGSGSFAGTDSGSGGQGQAPSAPSALSASGQSTSSNSTSSVSFARVLSQQASDTSIREQITFHIKTIVSDGSSRIRIQLEPAELGKLDIKLNIGADGKTGVVITADTRSTLDLLQRDVQGLARALADAGLTTDSGSLSFNLRGQGQDGNQQAAGSYQKMQPEDEDVDLNVITRSYVVNLAEGLDIKI